MHCAIPRHSNYDVIIIGARCAGAATAMLLARAGLQVLAIDRGPYGSDTLSTHALMRPSVLQLSRWGLMERLRAGGTPPATKTVFHYGRDEVAVTIEPRDGVDALYAPRRSLLDRLLVDAARAAGAEICHGPQLVGLNRADSGSVTGVRIRCAERGQISIATPLVVGADGRNSMVARLVKAPTYRQGHQATATLYGYYAGFASDEPPTNHWFYGSGPGISAGLIPTDDQLTLFFVSAPAEVMRAGLRKDPLQVMQAGLAIVAPQIATALLRAQRVGRLQGFGGQVGHFRQSYGSGWALVGDAGYFKDPITAHGISDALRDAELLARAICEGTKAGLAAYQATRDSLSERFFSITDEVATCTWTLPEIGQLHRDMSREIKQECRFLCALERIA